MQSAVSAPFRQPQGHGSSQPQSPSENIKIASYLKATPPPSFQHTPINSPPEIPSQHGTPSPFQHSAMHTPPPGAKGASQVFSGTHTVLQDMTPKTLNQRPVSILIDEQYFCAEHPAKKAKYVANGTNNTQKFCSKCAVNFAMRGKNVWEIENQEQLLVLPSNTALQLSEIRLTHASPRQQSSERQQPSREERIRNFLHKLQRDESLARTAAQSVEVRLEQVKEHYTEQTEKLLLFFHSLESVIELEKNRILVEVNDSLNGALDRLEKCLQDLSSSREHVLACRKEIELNFERIVSQMDEEPFELVFGDYDSRIAEIEQRVENSNAIGEGREAFELKILQNDWSEDLQSKLDQVLPKLVDALLTQKQAEYTQEQQLKQNSAQVPEDKKKLPQNNTLRSNSLGTQSMKLLTPKQNAQQSDITANGTPYTTPHHNNTKRLSSSKKNSTVNQKMLTKALVATSPYQLQDSRKILKIGCNGTPVLQQNCSNNNNNNNSNCIGKTKGEAISQSVYMNILKTMKRSPVMKHNLKLQI